MAAQKKPRPKGATFNQKVTIEEKRLRKLYADLTDTTLQINRDLIRQMAFYSISIADLQKQVAKDGTTTKYQNGRDQWGVKTNPDIETLNKYAQQYRHTKKALEEARSKNDAPIQDGFNEFING